MKTISSENLLDLLSAYNFENCESKYQKKMENDKKRKLKPVFVFPYCTNTTTIYATIIAKASAM